jgi:hypothetical protein
MAVADLFMADNEMEVEATIQMRSPLPEDCRNCPVLGTLEWTIVLIRKLRSVAAVAAIATVASLRAGAGRLQPSDLAK